MPESSAWPDIRRWGELHNNEDDFDEEDEGHLEAAVVVHNELYVSEGEEDGIHSGLINKSFIEARKIRVKVWNVRSEFNEEDEGEEDGTHSGLIYKSFGDQKN